MTVEMIQPDWEETLARSLIQSAQHKSKSRLFDIYDFLVMSDLHICPEYDQEFNHWYYVDEKDYLRTFDSLYEALMSLIVDVLMLKYPPTLDEFCKALHFYYSETYKDDGEEE